MFYFLAYLLLELAVTVPAFSNLGVLGSFFEIIFSALLGFFLITNSSYTLSESFSALRENKISPFMFQSITLLSILGAILLILPGVFTDILGILFQFGFISTIIAKLTNKNTNNNTQNFTQNERREDEDIIDVEVIEHSDTK